MHKELEQKISNELQSENLSEYSAFLGLDEDDFEDFYYDINFDDYSK